VDEEALPIVNLINAHDNYATTSSCSGRVSLFHRCSGSTEPSSLSSTESADESERRKRGRYGQGALFQSHEAIVDVSGTALSITKVLADLKVFGADSDPPTEFLSLRFEPFILHVMCRSNDDAAVLLQAASQSGQRRSGILSASRGVEGHRRIVCNITSALHFDAPLKAQGMWLLRHRPGDGVQEDWTHAIAVLLRQCNHLFDENRRRRDRLRIELQARLQ
jgi:tRNA wybutosine-synthesizing protein 3